MKHSLKTLIAISSIYCGCASAQTRTEFVNGIFSGLASNNIIESISAAEQGLASGDRVTKQILLEPILQHKDRRVRQVGLVYLVSTISRFQIDVSFPEKMEKGPRSTDAENHFKRYRLINLSIEGYDPKTGEIKTYLRSKVDQSGITILLNDDCKLNMTGADQGLLLGYLDCLGYATKAAMALP